jgi:hypothetical protein
MSSCLQITISGTFPVRVVAKAWFKAKVVSVVRSLNEMDSVWRPLLKVTLHLTVEKTTEQPIFSDPYWYPIAD